MPIEPNNVRRVSFMSRIQRMTPVDIQASRVLPATATGQGASIRTGRSTEHLSRTTDGVWMEACCFSGGTHAPLEGLQLLAVALGCLRITLRFVQLDETLQRK